MILPRRFESLIGILESMSAENTTVPSETSGSKRPARPVTLRIMFVCTGNTCRSPMAERLCIEVARKLGASKVEAISAGIDANVGSVASPHAAFVMREMGVDLSGHRARQLTAGLVEQVDLVLTMTPAQATRARAIVGANVRVQTLGDYAGMLGAVEDPLDGGVDRYRRTAEQIERLLTAGLSKIAGVIERSCPD